ncbi:MAG: hypothetical protein JW759_02040 [Candidatus Coatesbacteria bacterium]|nr:hypothetical protein [Candidatus Coatesbacteria bacterium]
MTKQQSLLLAIVVLLFSSLSMAEEITVEFTSGDIRVDDIETGEVIRIDGFALGGQPGAPMLPMKVVNVAFPPDVVWDSVTLSVVDGAETSISGVFDVAPRSPIATREDGAEAVVDWCGASNLVDGKDMDIYGSDTFWPASRVEVLSTGQMRKWEFVRVAFWPIKYNPVSRQLLECESVTVKFSFSTNPALRNDLLLADTVMDSLAARKFVNYRAAKEWYTPELTGHDAPADDSYDYVIITTDAIVANSSKLADLESHLQSLGHQVLVVTETVPAGGYGSKTGQSPNGTAEKIRQWLIDNAAEYGILYVLLIGNPHPSNGDVPMKMCYPRHNYSSYTQSPTDYFYADLTGDWDIDGDGYFGEYPDASGDNGDDGADGVDFTPDVYVGRIPVYNSNYSELDGIIQKVINYETASGDLSWRLSALLPNSFLWAGVQGAYYGHALKTERNMLADHGYKVYEMYEQRHTNCWADFDPHQNLLANVVRDKWASYPFGMVWWLGHGASTYTVIGHGGTGCASLAYLFHEAQANNLDDDHPAFVYMASCNNGYPEVTNNVAYSVLAQGGVGTVGASRVSWGETSNFDSSWRDADLRSIGYEFAKLLIDHANYGVGYSLYEAKSTISRSASAWWMNMMDFNLYGCPHTGIYDGSSTAWMTRIALDSFEAKPGPNSVKLTWATGSEIDNAGFIVYRAEAESTDYQAISGLIEPKGGPSQGASYVYLDTDVRPGVKCAYWLVDVDVRGKATAHGPVYGASGSAIVRPIGAEYRGDGLAVSR